MPTRASTELNDCPSTPQAVQPRAFVVGRALLKHLLVHQQDELEAGAVSKASQQGLCESRVILNVASDHDVAGVPDRLQQAGPPRCCVHHIRMQSWGSSDWCSSKVWRSWLGWRRRRCSFGLRFRFRFGSCNRPERGPSSRVARQAAVSCAPTV